MTKQLRVGAVILSFILGGRLVAEEVNSDLSCSELRTIYQFVLSNHLRFQQLPAAKAADEARSLLKSAQVAIPSTLRLLGYPFVAANVESRLLPIWKSQNLEPVEFCKRLEPSLLRASYLKSFLKSLDPYSDFLPH